MTIPGCRKRNQVGPFLRFDIKQHKLGMVPRSGDQQILPNPLHTDEVLRFRHQGVASGAKVVKPELGASGFTIIRVNQEIPIGRPTCSGGRTLLCDCLLRATVHAGQIDCTGGISVGNLLSVRGDKKVFARTGG